MFNQLSSAFARWSTLGLLVLAAVAQAADLSEAELVRQLSAKAQAQTPARPGTLEEDPFAAFGNQGADSRNLNQVRAPDLKGACMPSEPAAGTSQRTLGIVALAPAGAPQVDLALQFETAAYQLTRNDQRQLDVLAGALTGALRDGRFTISGHTDASGDPAINEKLSCARALSVRTYLMGRGVEAERISAYGFGSSRPLAIGRAEAAENRRVEIRRAER